MPFAEYKSFDACVKANSDKDDPEAYCATIMRKIEEGSQKNADTATTHRGKQKFQIGSPQDRYMHMTHLPHSHRHDGKVTRYDSGPSSKHSSLPFSLSSIKVAQLSAEKRNEIEGQHRQVLEERLIKMVEDLSVKYQMKSELEIRSGKNKDDMVVQEELKRINNDIQFLLTDILRADNEIKGKPQDANLLSTKVGRLQLLAMNIEAGNPELPDFTTKNKVNRYAFAKLPSKRKQGELVSLAEIYDKAIKK